MTEEKDKLEDMSKSEILFTIKGEEYTLSVLTIRDLADFRQHIKGEKIKLVQGIVKNSVERVQLIERIVNSSINETMEMTTMDGVCFLLWKSLSKKRKGLLLEQVDEMIDLDNIAEVSAVLSQLGGRVKPPFPGKKSKNK